MLAISLWRESNLSQGAFCLREGIARSTFQHWRKRYDSTYVHQGKKKAIPSKSAKQSFIPLEMKGTTSSVCNALEIIYSNGVRIKCGLAISSDDLQKLVTLQMV